jgi:hypothetical protein
VVLAVVLAGIGIKWASRIGVGLGREKIITLFY